MPTTLTLSVAGVRFTKVGKVYHFDARNVTDLQVGDQVVVETSRGWQLGTVAQVVPAIQAPEGMKIIDRKATPRDLLMRQTWQMREEEVLEAGKKRAVEIGLVGIKVVSTEYSFDGSRLTIMFSSESEEKYELKSLRQDMQRMFAPAQVELRQLGPRDVAKMMGGMGACGKETRCCSEFLCEFSSISIRMAKEQGISLTPTEITGMCGRLRCCLIYEYDQYTSARALLPKRNKRIMTAQGEGRVIDQIPIRDSVYVQLLDDTRREYKRSEFQLIDDNGVPIPTVKVEGDDEVSLAVEREVEVEDEPLLPTQTQFQRAPESSAQRPVGDGSARSEGNSRGRSDARGGRPDRQRGPNPSQTNAASEQTSRGQNRQQSSNRPPQGRPDANRAPQETKPPEERPVGQNRPPQNSQPQNRPNNPGNRPGQPPRRRPNDRRGPGGRPGIPREDTGKADDDK